MALAETGNFTKAAEKTFVVQSTFSSGIKKLEALLNTQLFYRDKRNVRLTNEGKVLLPKAQQMLHIWNQIEADFNETENKVLKIGLLNNILMDAILPRISQFKQRYIDHKLMIEEASKDTLMEGLLQDKLECIVIKQAPIDEELLDSQFLYEEKLALAISSQHPLAQKKKVELKQLQGLPFIQRNTCALFDKVYQTLQLRGIELNKVFSTQNDEAVRGLIASGVGCSLMSKPPHPEKGISYVPLSDVHFTSQIILVWKKNNQFNALKKFLVL